jgi:hypothetical protein
MVHQSTHPQHHDPTFNVSHPFTLPILSPSTHTQDQVFGAIADTHLVCETMRAVSGPFVVFIFMRCRASRPIIAVERLDVEK